MATKKAEAKNFEELKGVEIFAAGTYHLGDDVVVTYTEADIEEIAENTNKLIKAEKHSPPGKLGHDGAQAFAAASGLPAIGWAENLRRVGKTLVADFKDIPALAFKALKQGLYKKISSEIYHEEASKREFGVDGKTLRAVAFLGADVPKVKGLAAFLAEIAPEEVGSDEGVHAIVYGEDKAPKGPLMVPANRHPYGALVTGAEGNESGLESGKKYHVHGVHMDGSYDVHESEDESKRTQRVPHDHLCLMSETQPGRQPATEEAQMSEKATIELAEKATKDAVELAEKNAREATEAKARVAKLEQDARDKTVSEFCEKHKTILTPALQPKFKALVSAAGGVGAVKFAEGDEKPYLDQLTAFLSELMTAKSVKLGEIAPTGKEEGADMREAEVKLAEEPFLVHLEEAKRSEVKPVIVHADLNVQAEEYAEKHPGVSFSQALKHVAKLEKVSIKDEGAA